MQIRLSCGANGKPDPEFTWYKDGNLIQSTDRIKVNNNVGMSSLVIQEAEVEDGGIYKVTARNRIAEISTESEVIIEGIVICFIESFYQEIHFIRRVRLTTIDLWLVISKIYFEVVVAISPHLAIVCYGYVFYHLNVKLRRKLVWFRSY